MTLYKFLLQVAGILHQCKLTGYMLARKRTLSVHGVGVQQQVLYSEPHLHIISINIARLVWSIKTKSVDLPIFVLFCEGTLWFEEQVHWRRHYQDARVSSWQHFRGLRGKGFPTDNRHSHGHKLCPSPSRHISILIRSGIHTVLALGR